jgi:hypothetical protein
MQTMLQLDDRNGRQHDLIFAVLLFSALRAGR